MRFRSTNNKFTHFQGEVLTNIDDSSHGVHLSGGSTGGIVQPCGDEDNIALTVRGKGTGAVTIGNSSQTVAMSSLTLSAGLSVTGPLTSTGAVSLVSTAVSLNSTKVSFAGSTTYFIAIRRVFVDGLTIPTMAASAGAEQGDIALTGLTTNAVVTMSPRGPLNSSVSGVFIHGYCSTAGQLHVVYQNAGTTITGSTMSAYALIHDINIPVP